MIWQSEIVFIESKKLLPETIPVEESRAIWQGGFGGVIPADNWR